LLAAIFFAGNFKPRAGIERVRLLAKINGQTGCGNWFAGKRDLLLGLIPCH
jgi:hypothetical protein